MVPDTGTFWWLSGQYRGGLWRPTLSEPIRSTGGNVPGTAQGFTGAVIFDGEWIRIVRQGFTAATTVGRGEKRIPLSSVAAVQFKPAKGGVGPFGRGYIEFTIPGGVEGRSVFTAQLMTAAYNENAVVFTFAQQPQFLMLRDDVESAIAARSRPHQPQLAAPAVATRLRQLADLRDQGLISSEEFEAKRAELVAGI